MEFRKKVSDRLTSESTQSADLLHSVLYMLIQCDDLQSAEALVNEN